MALLLGSEMGPRLNERTALSRNRTATLESAEPGSDPASDTGYIGSSPRRKGPSFSGGARNTGPLPRSRSSRKKKGLVRRTGIVFPAIAVAAFLVAVVTVASYMMSPKGSGASSLAPAFGMLQ